MMIKKLVTAVLNTPPHIRSGYWLILLLVLADQSSKWFMTNFVPPRGFYVEILPIFNLVLSENYGAGFGFLAGYGGIANLVFIIVSLIITVFLFVMLMKAESDCLSFTKNPVLPMMLVISGAFGNLIDRIWRGAVIDFLDFHIGDYHWPAFNLADSFISIGAFLWLLYEWRNSRANGKTEK